MSSKRSFAAGVFLTFFVNFFFPLQILTQAIARFISEDFANQLEDIILIMAAIGVIYLIVRYFRTNLGGESR